jgi:hypothetical protein
MSVTLYQELLESREVIPQQLVRIPGGKAKERKFLLAREAMWLAKVAASYAGKSHNPEVLARAKYEAALAMPFAKWAAKQRRLGRPEHDLVQGAFWTERRQFATMQ